MRTFYRQVIFLVLAFLFLAQPTIEASLADLAEDLLSLAVTEIHQEDKTHLGFWPAGIDTSSLKLFKAGNNLIYTGLFSFVASDTDITNLRERLKQTNNADVQVLPLKAQTFSYRIEHNGKKIAERPLAGGSWRDMPLNLVFEDSGNEKEIALDMFIRFEWQDQIGWKSSENLSSKRIETPEKIETTNISGKFRASSTGLRNVEVKRSIHLTVNH